MKNMKIIHEAKSSKTIQECENHWTNLENMLRCRIFLVCCFVFFRAILIPSVQSPPEGLHAHGQATTERPCAMRLKPGALSQPPRRQKTGPKRPSRHHGAQTRHVKGKKD